MIVGGRNAQPRAWPWMAAILDGNLKFICGAALIERKWVMTAAHCIADLKKSPQPYQVSFC